MSLRGYWNDLIGQQPFGTSDQIAATDASVAAQEQAITNDKYQQIADTKGLDAANAYLNQVNADYAAQPDSSVEGQAQQIDQAFAEGAKEGLKKEINVLGSVIDITGKTAGQILWAILKNLPWWIYVAGAVVLAVLFLPEIIEFGAVLGLLKRKK